MKLIFAIGFVLSIAACSSNPDEKVTKETTLGVRNFSAETKNLKTFEDSLKKVSKDGMMDYNQETAVIYAEKCLAIAHRYPKSKDAAKFMDKAHIIFASVGLNQRSVMTADTLIMKYPYYKNRAMVLESLAGSYDVFVIPRQKDKVKYYYELLLKENPKMNQEQRKDIEDRLKYINLTFDEYISRAK